MSLVDDDVDLGEDDILPPRRPRPDPPASNKQQEVIDQGTVTPPVENRERPAKRSPLARGTVTLGGIGVAGTLLAVIGAAAGPLALVATAAGTVLVPLAWFTRKARANNRRGSSRRRGNGGRGRRGNASWWPGGLGGGGKRGRTGTIGGGGAGRGSRGAGTGTGGGRRTAGARSGGLPGTGGSRRRAAGGAGGAGSRRGAGTGLPGTGGSRRRAGTGANWSGARGRTNGRGGLGGGRHGRLGGGRLGGRRGLGGRGRGYGRVSTPRFGGRVARGIGRGLLGGGRGIGRGIGRGARGLNTGGFNLGSAARRGVRKPTGRRAFTKAYQQYGKKRSNPTTVTGYAGRVLGGAVAGMSAGTMRFLANQGRKLLRSLRNTYFPPQPQQQPAQQNQQQAPPGQQQPGQHPVPPPAFTPPAPAPASPGQPTPAGSGSGSNPGGSTPMSTAFPPYDLAVDFYSACMKFQPVGPNGRPSIWPLRDALPQMKASIYLMVNGYGAIVASCENTLNGGLNPVMRQAMGELWSGLAKASRIAENLEPAFVRGYADAIARENTPGRQAENV